MADRVCDLDPFNSVVTPEGSDVDILKTELEDYLRRLKDAICDDFQELEVPQMSYGEIYTNDNTVPTVIAAPLTFVQVEVFDTNGEASRTTPDHTEDHIVIDRAGHYFVAVSASCLSGAGGGAVFHCVVCINNGTTFLENLQWHRRLAGGGGDVGSTSISGVANFAEGDTVELWIENETNGTDILFRDVTLSIIELGRP